MQKFSTFIAEARQNHDSVSLLQSEITSFINKVKKRIPADVQRAIYLTQKYNITTAEDLDKVRTANKSALKGLVDVLNIPIKDLEDLWGLMKQIKSNYRVMPQYLSASEREALEKGALSADDLTIDLKTSAGRNATTKMYMPLVYAIVNKYVGKSRLDKAALISAGLLGLANAINDWKPEPDEKTGRVVPFKTYAGYRIQQQILNDMDELGHSLSGTNWYATKEYGAGLLDAISLDGLPRDSDGDFDQSKLAALGVEDEPKGDEAKKFDALYKLIERNFKQRDCDVFYRFFGLNGRKREKSKDIAASFGMSEGNIRNSILNKMLKFLKTNTVARDLLMDIQDIYTESIMCDLYGLSKEQIIDALVSDDTFILLEEICRWRSKDVFAKSLSAALNMAKDQILAEIVAGGFDEADAHIKTHKNSYINFLKVMYPTENISNLTDVGLIEKMKEVQEAYKKFKK